MVDQGDHGERRGVAGSADHHRVAETEPVGQRHDPVGRNRCELGEPAVTGHAEVVAVGDHLGAGRRVTGILEEHAREVDPGDHR